MSSGNNHSALVCTNDFQERLVELREFVRQLAHEARDAVDLGDDGVRAHPQRGGQSARRVAPHAHRFTGNAPAPLPPAAAAAPFSFSSFSFFSLPLAPAEAASPPLAVGQSSESGPSHGADACDTSGGARGDEDDAEKANSGPARRANTSSSESGCGNAGGTPCCV